MNAPAPMVSTPAGTTTVLTLAGIKMVSFTSLNASLHTPTTVLSSISNGIYRSHCESTNNKKKEEEKKNQTIYELSDRNGSHLG
jgi:hypothetical protein